MERFVIVMPVGTSAYLLPCDDGDTCKLETLQNLVGGPIEVVDSCLAGNWSRESDVEAVKLVVNEEGEATGSAGERERRDPLRLRLYGHAGGPGGAGGRAGRGPDRLCEAGGREHLRRVGDPAGSDRHGRVLPDL